jgi:hypothetical protein
MPSGIGTGALFPIACEETAKWLFKTQGDFMKIFLRGGASALPLLILAGCQTVPYQGKARDVKRAPQVGGTIAVPLDPKQEDRLRAEERMRSNCNPNPYKITSEEEVVVGEKTDTDQRDTLQGNNQREVGSLFGMPLVSGDAGGSDSRSSSTKTAIKEWVIGYACVTAPTGKVKR